MELSVDLSRFPFCPVSRFSRFRFLAISRFSESDNGRSQFRVVAVTQVVTSAPSAKACARASVGRRPLGPNEFDAESAQTGRPTLGVISATDPQALLLRAVTQSQRTRQSTRSGPALITSESPSARARGPSA